MGTTIVYIIIGIAQIIASFFDVLIVHGLLIAFVIIDFSYYIYSCLKTEGMQKGFDCFKWNILFMVVSLAIGFPIGFFAFKLGALASISMGTGLYCIVTAIGNYIIERHEEKLEELEKEEKRRLKKEKKALRNAKRYGK